MAPLYGRLRGSRGEATRCGSDVIESTVETWNGIVRVSLRKNGSYYVETSGKHGERRREVLAGNVDDDRVSYAAPVETICGACSRRIVLCDGAWIDPEASGDDSMWREVCDASDTFTAEHVPA